MPTKRKIKPAESTPTPSRRMAAQPYFRIGFLVHDVSRMRRTVFDQAIKPLGVTRAQWWALANLSRHEPEGMIQSDLARLLDVGKVTVGGLIDRLEASGHVERRADAQDRRIKRIFIKDKGYEVIEKMQSLGHDLNRVILKGISLDQIHLAEEVMARMKANLRDCLDASAPVDTNGRDRGIPGGDEMNGLDGRL